jgi:hypothetical protein
MTYLKPFNYNLQMFKALAITQTITSVVAIVPATIAYGQQIRTYTNSDPSYAIWKVKV